MEIIWGGVTNKIKYFRPIKIKALNNKSFFFQVNLSDYENELRLPTEEDLNGAIVALTRLQKIYKLTVPELANGNLNGIQSRLIKICVFLV